MRYAAGCAALLLALAGCSSIDAEPTPTPTPTPTVSPTVSPTASDPSPPAEGDPQGPAPVPATVDVGDAIDTPHKDSVYPDLGDPGVDALHYDLDLRWDPATRVLRGRETLRFRATADQQRVRLDLSSRLRVVRAVLDGRVVATSRPGDDVLVEAPVREGSRHRLVLVYRGRPGPVHAPSRRKDVEDVGFTVTDEGGAWTMQEPYGAFTWYAVNDQPGDRAFYDFTLAVPDPMVGVANGVLVSRETSGGVTTTRWHLDRVAPSYLVTVAFADLVETSDESASGVPISYWVPRGREDITELLRFAPDGLDWLESRLGPYPGSSLGFVIVPSTSGMETTSMITLGDTAYDTSPEVLVHEMAHQWYGDQVTPDDWRDLWMSEGMATFLQAVWGSEHGGTALEARMDEWHASDGELRADFGPPAAYRPDSFGAGTVYLPPAVMWDELRQRLGDDEFYALVRAWPGVDPDGSSNRTDYLAWIEARTGLELTAFFDDWLLGTTTPERGLR